MKFSMVNKFGNSRDANSRPPKIPYLCTQQQHAYRLHHSSNWH